MTKAGNTFDIDEEKNKESQWYSLNSAVLQTEELLES